MLRAEFKDVSLQERQVHQHAGLVQVRLPARICPLRSAQLLRSPKTEYNQLKQGVTTRGREILLKTLI